MNGPTILRLRFLDGVVNQNGDEILTVFDVAVAGIEIRNLPLIRHPAGTLFLGDAIARVKGRGSTGAKVTDRMLKRAIVRAAHAIAARQDPGFPPLVLYPARVPDDPPYADDEAGLRQFLGADDVGPRRHRGRRPAEIGGVRG